MILNLEKTNLMKKILLSLMVVTGLSASSLSAQVIWDIADTAKFPSSITVPYTVDIITFSGAEGATFTLSNNSLSFPDSFAGTRRFQFGGNSYSGSTNPAVGTTQLPQSSKKWVELAVSKNANIKIWARGGGNGRSILISDNTGLVLNSTTFAGSSSSDVSIISYDYVGTAATTLLITAGGGDNYIYKLQYTDNSTLAASNVRSINKANIFADGKKIYVTDLENKNTEITVYSSNGQLMKTLKSSSDTSFDMNEKGLFIIGLRSEAGERISKVLIK